MSGQRYYCSFCCRDERQVEVIVAGPALVCICNECIEDCAAVVAAKRRDNALNAEWSRCAFCNPSPLSIGLQFAAHFLRSQ